MPQIAQGEILDVEKIEMPVLVVSRDFFNQSEQVMACPIVQSAKQDALHIEVSAEGAGGTVLCEQMKLLNLRTRNYRRVSRLCLEDIANITDSIQSVLDCKNNPLLPGLDR